MRIFAFALAMLFLTGCMTKYEWLARQQDMAIKAKHQETYSPIVLKGPVYVPEGGQITSTVPNFPYQHTPIPDGQAYQVDMAGKVLNAATVLGGGYLIKRAGNGGDTVINNNAPAAEGGN